MKLSDNHAIHAVYKQSQNSSKYVPVLEMAMKAQGIV